MRRFHGPLWYRPEDGKLEIFSVIILVIALSFLFTVGARKISVPTVVSLIVLGILIGIPFVSELLLGSAEKVVVHIGDFGLVALMFLAGLESSWHKLYEEKKDAVLIAVACAALPFFLGLVVFLLMGFSLTVSLIIAICMSITAEATKAKVLFDIKKLKTKVGSAMMGAGIIDDLIGFSLFLITTLILHATKMRENILIVSSVIAFFMGVYIHNLIKRSHKYMEITENVLNYGLVPFFFVSMGIRFEFNSLFINPWLLLVIMAVAFLGKMGGTFIIAPFTDFKWDQLHLIGWAMNSRGAVELALALIALRSGILPENLYSSLIIMVLFTTLAFPFVVKYMVRKDKRIMEK